MGNIEQMRADNREILADAQRREGELDLFEARERAAVIQYLRPRDLDYFKEVWAPKVGLSENDTQAAASGNIFKLVGSALKKAAAYIEGLEQEGVIKPVDDGGMDSPPSGKAMPGIPRRQGY